MKENVYTKYKALDVIHFYTTAGVATEPEFRKGKPSAQTSPYLGREARSLQRAP